MLKASMTLKKGFLKNGITWDQLTHSRLLVGVFIGLIVSLSFYSLQYTIRETIRFSSISDDFDIWILSDTETNFYNLVFAFISVITGQSFSLMFWFDRPKKVFGLRSTRLRSIVNDQRVMNWFFMCWFSKVATMYGFLFGTAGVGGYYLMSFYPEYKYLFVLIIVVLFLQTWTSLLLVYKRSAQKWMLISAVVVSMLSFGISKINLIDYKLVNESIEGRRLDVKYHLELPESNIYETLTRKSRYRNFSLVLPKNDIDGTRTRLYIEGKLHDFFEVPAKILDIKSRLHSMERELFSPRVHIHKTIKMVEVNRLKKILAESGCLFLHYAVVPKNSKIDKRYYNHLEITSFNIYNQFDPDFEPRKAKERMDKDSNKIVVEITQKGYLVNGIPVEPKDLKRTIQEQIAQNLDYWIELFYSEEETFEVYFKALSAIKEAIFELRDELSVRKFGYKFEDLNTIENRMKKEHMEVIEKYPFRFLEIIETCVNNPNTP